MTAADTIVQDRDFVYIRHSPVRHATAARDWRCGTCESKLVTRWVDGQFATLCAGDPRHPVDGFVHQSTLAQRVHVEMTQAGNLGLAIRRTQMGLRDRDDERGVPLRTRLGRIGRVRQGIVATNAQGKRYPKAIDYFILDPTTDNQTEREQVLADVRAAIEHYAPGQDLERPQVLPITFLASNREIIAPESYKVRRGRAGTVWCAGDGETIQWKLSDDFQVEIAQGTQVKTGQVIHCPGGRDESRHPWCDLCSGELEINFAIVGYERTGIWMLRTKSMTFRDQFWTQVGMVMAMAERGIIPGLVGAPFLLRRKNEMVLSPTKSGALAAVEMPITSIEVHPAWFQAVMRRSPQLLLGAQVPTPAGYLGPGQAREEGIDWAEYDLMEGDDDDAVVTVSAPAPQPQAKSASTKPEGTRPAPAPAAPATAPATNGKCPVCMATGSGHAPWCQPANPAQPDGPRHDTRQKSAGTGTGPAQDAAPAASRLQPRPLEAAPAIERPLAADRVRAIVRQKAGWQPDAAGDLSARWLQGEPISQPQVRTVIGLLSAAVRRQGMTQSVLDQARHDVMEYLLGVRSTDDLYKREASAVIAWLARSTDDVRNINGYAAAEAAAILNAVDIARGQMTLIQDEAPPADEPPEETPAEPPAAEDPPAETPDEDWLPF